LNLIKGKPELSCHRIKEFKLNIKMTFILAFSCVSPASFGSGDLSPPKLGFSYVFKNLTFINKSNP